MSMRGSALDSLLRLVVDRSDSAEVCRATGSLRRLTQPRREPEVDRASSPAPDAGADDPVVSRLTYERGRRGAIYGRKASS
jgi:hypothetical protein